MLSEDVFYLYCNAYFTFCLLECHRFTKQDGSWKRNEILQPMLELLVWMSHFTMDAFRQTG